VWAGPEGGHPDGLSGGTNGDITDAPDGRYRLRILVDPAGHIIESNTNNSQMTMVIEISGSSVQILED